MTFFDNLFPTDRKIALDHGLKKTKESFLRRLARAVAGKSKVNDETLDALEEVLIASDVGVSTTIKIIDRIQKRVSKDNYLGADELYHILKEEISALLLENNTEKGLVNFEIHGDIKPYVILVVGVNGVGKTTTIGKLAAQFKKNNKSVMLGAADTFRAAAVDQLQLWGKRVGAPVVTKPMNTDPSAVAYDAVRQGLEKNVDVVIIDTAGRLHNKVNLMNELSKIKRVVQKVVPEGPHDVLLVLDGGTGQNALVQAREFAKAVKVTGIAVTKLDGTSKGGVVIGISDEFKIPIKYIGVGEKLEDLHVFDKTKFIDSMFGNN